MSDGTFAAGGAGTRVSRARPEAGNARPRHGRDVRPAGKSGGVMSSSRGQNRLPRLKWLGREDSKLPMREPKSRALPLGHAPPTKGVSVTDRPRAPDGARPMRVAPGAGSGSGWKPLAQRTAEGKSGAQNNGAPEHASTARRAGTPRLRGWRRATRPGAAAPAGGGAVGRGQLAASCWE